MLKNLSCFLTTQWPSGLGEEGFGEGGPEENVNWDRDVQSSVNIFNFD